jgi:hypothetical protein
LGQPIVPSLVVSIDTEEEGLWGGKYDAHPQTKNLKGLERFQRFCEDRAVVPTYLIDAPVVMDEWAVQRLRTWQDAGRCEVGSHCHPWCNPPLDGKPISNRSTFMCSLDGASQRHKLEWLTDQIETKIGRRPSSFRAGRYGLDSVGANALADLGYTVDSSVLPFRDYAKEGGADFRKATIHPYRVDESDLLRSNPLGKLLEVPVTAGFTKPGFRWRNRCRRFLTETPLRKLRLAGLADRLGVLRWAKLSPEQTHSEDAKQLINAAIEEKATVLVLMFHSSSLLPSFSPYVRTAAELESFYGRLDEIFTHCLEANNCQSATLTEFANQWLLPGQPTNRNNESSCTD